MSGLFSLFRPTMTLEPLSEITQELLACWRGFPVLLGGGGPGDVAGDSSPLPSSIILQHTLHLLHQPSAATSDATCAQPACPFHGRKGKPGRQGGRFLNDK